MKRADQSERAKVGARIKKFRVKAGLSADQLAGLAGIDRTHQYSVERGRAWASLDLIHNFAGILREDLADFFVYPHEHQRHKFRELARLLKPSELTLVMKAAERALGRSIDEMIEEDEPDLGEEEEQPSVSRKAR